MGLKAEGNIKAGRLGKYKNPDTDERRQCRPLLISTDNPYFMEKCFARSHYLKDFRLTIYIKKFLPRAKRVRKRGRDISSPAIWATKTSAHFGDNNVAQMSCQICSHTSSALNAGAKRSGATCRMAMPQCCYLAKGAKRPSHTTNMLTSLNISVN